MKILTDKQVNDAINRIAANQIIAEDALKRTLGAETLSLERYLDANSHFMGNSIKLASIIGGMKGIAKLNSLVEGYRNQLSQEGGSHV